MNTTTDVEPPALFAVCEAHGITQAEIARRLGLHKTTINKHWIALKEGRVTLKLRHAKQIAALISELVGEEWTVDDLFGVPS